MHWYVRLYLNYLQILWHVHFSADPLTRGIVHERDSKVIVWRLWLWLKSFSFFFLPFNILKGKFFKNSGSPFHILMTPFFAKVLQPSSNNSSSRPARNTQAPTRPPTVRCARGACAQNVKKCTASFLLISTRPPLLLLLLLLRIEDCPKDSKMRLE